MYGVGNSSLKWFKNYLSDREQTVEINGTTSDWELVKAGVPQGSILGPLMFILYINELPRVVKKCKITLYADDTALYISSNDHREIKQWPIWKNGLTTLNVKKTKFMQFSAVKKKETFSDIQVELDQP